MLKAQQLLICSHIRWTVQLIQSVSNNTPWGNFVLWNSCVNTVPALIFHCTRNNRKADGRLVKFNLEFIQTKLLLWSLLFAA